MYNLKFNRLISLLITLLMCSLLQLPATATGAPLLLLDYTEIDNEHFKVSVKFCDIPAVSVIAMPLAFNNESVAVCSRNEETGEFFDIADGALSEAEVNSGSKGIKFSENLFSSEKWGGGLLYNDSYPYISNSEGIIRLTLFSVKADAKLEGENEAFTVYFKRLSNASAEIRIANEKNTINYDEASPEGALFLINTDSIEFKTVLNGDVFSDGADITVPPVDDYVDDEVATGTEETKKPVTGNSDSQDENKTEVLKPITNEKISFSDVENGFWAYEAIYSLAEKKIITGYGDNTYNPNGLITRAELTRVAVAAAGVELLENEKLFADSDIEKWYNRYLISAYKGGLISGYPDNTFKPEKNITREDLCVVLAKAFFENNDNNIGELTFNDRAEISAYAADAVGKLTAAGILQGRDGNLFEPKENATRAEVARIVYLCVNKD